MRAECCVLGCETLHDWKDLGAGGMIWSGGGGIGMAMMVFCVVVS